MRKGIIVETLDGKRVEIPFNTGKFLIQFDENGDPTAVKPKGALENKPMNDTERLALGTPAGTYVEQNDVPNVIFFQAGADASDPDSWIAFRSNDDSDFPLPTVPLAVADPSTEGAAADIDTLGKATDGSYWIKTGANNTAWEYLVTDDLTLDGGTF